MRKSLFILFFFCSAGSFAQTGEQFIIYDVNIKDTATHLPVAVSDYQSEYGVYQNIPLKERQAMIESLIQSVKEEKYLVYRRYDMQPDGSAKIRFPVISVDTVQLQEPYPPYNWRDTVSYIMIEWKNVRKIRFYERWYYIHGLLRKEILAWSFILNSRSYMPDQEWEPYIFIMDKKYLPFLQENIKHD